jgi:hypothetical protein
MHVPDDWQEQVAAALLDVSLPVPDSLRHTWSHARFRIHRETFYGGLVEVLAAHFPVCRAVVGGEFFAAMARIFVELHPPRSPVLLQYGEELPEFIASYAPASSTPYLPDLASLEAARRRSFHAADLEPLAVETLASIPPCRWETSRTKLHPALEITSSRWPILSIWQAHAEGAFDAIGWKPEDVLVTRPGLQVIAQLLPPGGAMFIDALSRRATFAEARRLAARDPAFDLVRVLAMLLRGGALVAIEPA